MRVKSNLCFWPNEKIIGLSFNNNTSMSPHRAMYTDTHTHRQAEQ